MKLLIGQIGHQVTVVIYIVGFKQQSKSWQNITFISFGGLGSKAGGEDDWNLEARQTRFMVPTVGAKDFVSVISRHDSESLVMSGDDSLHGWTRSK